MNHQTGIYFSDSYQLQADDQEGLIYLTNFSVSGNSSGLYFEFNGGNALIWMRKHNGTILSDQLSHIAERQHRETIVVSGLQGFDQQHNTTSGTYYLHTGTLIEILDEGKILEVSQNNPVTLIGLAPRWTTTQLAGSDDFASEVRLWLQSFPCME